jgi:drug/metabolite transporter (DMT)-like permease
MPAIFSKITDQIWNSPHSVLLLATLMWGGHTIVARASVGEISPMLLMEMRWIGCFAVLAVLVRGELRATWPLVRARLGWTWLMGGVGMSGFTIFFILAAHFTPAVNLGITQSAIPAFVMLIGLLFLGTRAGLVQIAGLCLSLVGVIVLVSRGSLAVIQALEFNGGDLLMLVACLSYAGYTVGLSRRINLRPLVMLTYFSLFACLTLGICVVIEYLQGRLILPGLNGMIMVLYCALFPSLMAQVMFMRGVELAGPNRAGLYINLIPVFGAMMAIFFLNETMYPYHGLSLAMVLGGIYVAERHKKTDHKVTEKVTTS